MVGLAQSSKIIDNKQSLDSHKSKPDPILAETAHQKSTSDPKPDHSVERVYANIRDKYSEKLIKNLEAKALAKQK